MSRTFAWTLRILGTALVLLSLLPACLYGVFHIGVWAPALVGVLLSLFPSGYDLLAPHASRVGKIVFRVVLSVIGCGFLFVFILLGVLFFRSSCGEPAEDAVVVVLGCTVQQDGPGQLLEGRLSAALSYLQRHPEALCIVSGGQGENEPTSEAFCMKTWLTERGIDESRILEEDRSANTDENLQFTAALLQENGLPNRIVIVTDVFHQYRAHVHADRYGLEAAAESAHAPWFLQQPYWIREIFGMLKCWFLE